jgi:Golgi nucleoside diphosphatase
VNPTFSNALENLIRNYFRSTGFLLTNSDEVKILDGVDEGIDEWFTVNYLLDKFQKV